MSTSGLGQHQNAPAVSNYGQTELMRSPESQGTYASLAVPAYRTLFTAAAIAFLSIQAQAVARGWLANELTGSNAGLGGVFMAFGIPMLLATPMGGVAADRYSKRRILIVTQSMLTVGALWIGLGVSVGFVEYWMLLVVSVIQGTAFAFLAPARMAMTSEVVGRELLTNAIVLSQMSSNAARVVGPAIAGVFIATPWIGTAGVYHVSTVLSVVSIVGLRTLPEGVPHEPTATSAWSDFGDSLRYVTRHRQVGLLLLVSFFVVMIGFPYLAFIPRYSTNVLGVGATGYGVLSAVSAVGAVLASMYVAGRAKGLIAWRIQTIAGLTFGVSLGLMAYAPSYGLALIAVFVVGAASSAFQAMNNSLMLSLTELEYHGRVQSLMMLSWGGFGMAALPLGTLADQIGLRDTIAITGVFVVASMAWYVLASSRARRQVGDAIALA